MHLKISSVKWQQFKVQAYIPYAMPYHGMPYHAIQYNTMQNIQYNAIQWRNGLCFASHSLNHVSVPPLPLLTLIPLDAHEKLYIFQCYEFIYVSMTIGGHSFVHLKLSFLYHIYYFSYNLFISCEYIA